MNLKTWLPLCLAIVLGLVAAKFARDMMNKNKGDTNAGNVAQIVVARQPIGQGEPLSADNCTMGTVSNDFVPEGAFKSLADLKDRVANVQMGKNQPITEIELAPIGAGQGLAVVVPQGKRAIAIEVNEFSGVGGMILPGCHVDLLATVAAAQNGEMIARTVVQNIEVGAVGQRMIHQPEKKGDEPQVFRSVTLIATPSEAEAIELAANSGRPRLVLRGGTDKELTQTAGVTTGALRGQVPIKVGQVASFNSVRVIRGSAETEVRIDGPVEASAKTNATTPEKALTGSDTSPATGGNH
jgi:pilus assembly protein CpaB